MRFAMEMAMTTQRFLSAAFKERERFFAHRSSAIFPLLIDRYTDLHIVFLNYWKIKNEIESIGINLRAYDSNGAQIARAGIEEIKEHNSISIRNDLLVDISNLPLRGMIEVEVVSSENLKFAFPALIGIFESEGLFSCVHSAGRIKNSDEQKRPLTSEETNWTCKFVRGIDGWAVTPFFHYFVGATPLPADAHVEVALRSAVGQIIETRTIYVGDMGPFSSKIFCADEIFDLMDMPPEGSFLSVKLVAHDVFPRLVVGNFYRDRQFLEVTHSFPVTEIEDYCPTSESTVYCSILSAQRSKALNLGVRVFPTNCDGEASASIRKKEFSEDCLVDSSEALNFETAPGNEGLSFFLHDQEEMRVLALSGNRVPSRLNASFRYSVKSSDSIFSTDIATGAKSSVYPPKFHHWGHGCVGGGFDTHILYHNNSHDPSMTKDNEGTLRIFGPDIEIAIPVRVAAESCLTIAVAKTLNLRDLPASPAFISWYLDMKNPIGEAFWVAYRNDGAIFGEHAF